MPNLFDKKSPYQRILANRSAEEDHHLVQQWLQHQVRPGLHAAGAALAMVINSCEPEKAHTVMEDPDEPIVRLSDDQREYFIAAELPEAAECMILLLDDAVLELINTYLNPSGTTLTPKELTQRLFLEQSQEQSFRRDIILTGLPRILAQTDSAGCLEARGPIPAGFIWTDKTMVLVVYNPLQK